MPNETNAHPHFTEGVAVVHNGIIENFAELQARTGRAKAYDFNTQTDTEVVAHLIARALRDGADADAVPSRPLKRAHGAYALAIMFEGEPDLI